MALVLNGSTGVVSDNIASLAATKLTGQVADANIAAMAATKLTGQVPDANAPSGSVIQVVSQIYTPGNINTTSTSFVAAGCPITITPMSTSSKILISYHNIQTHKNTNAGNGGAVLTMYRNVGGAGYNTNLGASDYGLVIYKHDTAQVISDQYHTSLVYYDSPSTTSSVSYDVFFKKIGSSEAYFYHVGWGTGRLVVTAMEIAA